MPARTWRHDGHSPHPPYGHSSADAKARAATDRPEPGGPVNSQACVIAPATALRSCATTASWPASSSNTLTGAP